MKPPKVDCWRRFERIVVLGCERFNDRIPRLEAELYRVGLIDQVRWSIDYVNPFLEKMQTILPFASEDNRRYFRCVYNHYQTVLSAYKDGCQSVLVMEDDIAFLKDIDKLSLMIESLPIDFDLAMLDKNYCAASRNAQFGNCGWVEIEGRFNSAGCYALSKKGMERIIKAYEKGITSHLINFDVLFTTKALGQDCIRYASFPNLAIQCNHMNSECPAMAEYLIKLRMHGVDMDAYNISIQDTAERIFRNALSGESINEVLDRLILESPPIKKEQYNSMQGITRSAIMRTSRRPKPRVMSW